MRAERGEVGAVRVHAVVALDDDPGALLGALVERSRDGVGVAVGDDDDARTREPGPVDEGGVVEGVAHDEVAGAGERGEGPDVRGVAAREREGVLDSQPRGERTLEAAVLVALAGDEPRGPSARRGHRGGPSATRGPGSRSSRTRALRAPGLRGAAAQPLALELLELLGEVGEGIRAHVFHVKHPPDPTYAKLQPWARVPLALRGERARPEDAKPG